MTNLYIPRDATKGDHHSFAQETNYQKVVAVQLDTDLVAVVHGPKVVLRLANDAVVADHEYRNAVVVAPRNILLVDHVGVGNFVEYRLRNAVLVVEVVAVHIAVIDQLVVAEVSVVIQRQRLRRRLVSNACSCYPLVQEM